MRITTTLAAAAAIAVSGVAASAGGLSTPAPEMTVAPVMMDTPAPAGSINSGYVVLGLLAALVAASGSF